MFDYTLRQKSPQQKILLLDLFFWTTKKIACHSNKAESTTHVFLHCAHFANQRLSLLNKIEDIDKLFFEKKDSLITQTLLFGDLKCFLTVNKSISQTIIRFMWCLQKWHNEPFLMISWMISSAPEEVHPEMVILFCKTHYPIRRYSAPLLSAHCRSTNHLLQPHVSQITFFFRFNIPWYFFPSC